MADAALIYRQGYSAGLMPDPLLTLSEWADAHRQLPQKGAAEPGQWRTSRTPYLKEIMDCLSPSSPIEEVVFMKGAQIGGTECGLNWLGYVIDQAPGPMLAVQPTVELAKRFSKQRVQPMIDSTPRLAAKVKESRARDSGNTMLAKDFAGGVLVITGANSAVGLRSMPARYLFLDEIDAFDSDVDGEGSPIALAEARQRTFRRRAKRLKVSTPTIQGMSKIEVAYHRSDQRKYHVPCPHCRALQPLVFAQLKWSAIDLPAREAKYECAECRELIEDHQKTWMMDPANGAAWIADNPEGAHGVAGFHLSSLYSPVGWLSWGEIAEMWEEAQLDNDELRVFVNTILGETWREKGEAPDWKVLYERRETYTTGTAPRGVLFVTFGADVQKDRVEIEFVGWGRAKRSWSLDYVVLPRSPADPEAWKDELTELIDRAFPTPDGVALVARGGAIDASYDTQEVYGWVRLHDPRRVIAIQGQDSATLLLGQPRATDITVNGRKLKRGFKYWPAGVSIAKGELYGWLRRESPVDGEEYPAGFCHFPQYSDEYFRQLTAEQLVSHKIKGGYVRMEWEKTRDRNEALDCRVYARIAAAHVGMDRWQDRNWGRLEEETGNALGEAALVPGENQRKPVRRPGLVMPKTQRPRDPYL